MKTLSDKIRLFDFYDERNISCIKVEYVKEAVKRVKERMQKEYLKDNEFTNPLKIIDEEFGKDLI